MSTPTNPPTLYPTVRLLSDIISLFVPPVCPVCGRLLIDGERTFCNHCRATAPMTGYPPEADNPMFQRFWGLVPIERASALIYFVKSSGWQRAIHDFKYRSAWRIALECGEWLGAELLESNLYYDVDIVVPVPLHKRKVLRRGYNQSAYIAEGVASMMELPLSTDNLVRLRNNANQAQRSFYERWENVDGIFAVRHPELFDGKHILLIDDVFTTGATLTACAEAILAACNGVRISIATLSTAQSDLTY